MLEQKPRPSSDKPRFGHHATPDGVTALLAGKLAPTSTNTADIAAMPPALANAVSKATPAAHAEAPTPIASPPAPQAATDTVDSSLFDAHAVRIKKSEDDTIEDALLRQMQEEVAQFPRSESFAPSTHTVSRAVTPHKSAAKTTYPIDGALPHAWSVNVNPALARDIAKLPSPTQPAFENDSPEYNDDQPTITMDATALRKAYYAENTGFPLVQALPHANKVTLSQTPVHVEVREINEVGSFITVPTGVATQRQKKHRYDETSEPFYSLVATNTGTVVLGNNIPIEGNIAETSTQAVVDVTKDLSVYEPRDIASVQQVATRIKRILGKLNYRYSQAPETHATSLATSTVLQREDGTYLGIFAATGDIRISILRGGEIITVARPQDFAWGEARHGRLFNEKGVKSGATEADLYHILDTIDDSTQDAVFAHPYDRVSQEDYNRAKDDNATKTMVNTELERAYQLIGTLEKTFPHRREMASYVGVKDGFVARVLTASLLPEDEIIITSGIDLPSNVFLQTAISARDTGTDLDKQAGAMIGATNAYIKRTRASRWNPFHFLRETKFNRTQDEDVIVRVQRIPSPNDDQQAAIANTPFRWEQRPLRIEQA